MKCFFLLVLLPAVVQGQLSHSFGGGAFVQAPRMIGYDDFFYDLRDQQFAITANPIVDYKLEARIIRATIGAGLSRSTFHYLSGYENIIGYWIKDGTHRDVYRYAFVPVSVGANILNRKTKVGVKLDVHAKYLYDVVTYYPEDVAFIPNAEVDWPLDAFNQFVLSVGGGAFAGFDVGRFTPTVAAGYLYDLQDAIDNPNYHAKFTNPYLQLAIYYRLNTTGDSAAR